MNGSFEVRTAYVFGYAGNFWLLFLAIAVLLWISPSFEEQEVSGLKATVLGTVSFLIGLCLRFSFHGVEVDAQERKIREFTFILGYKTGDWKPLPNLSKLRLSSYSASHRNILNGTSPTFRSTITIYTITLVSENPLSDYSINLTNRKQALKTAQVLAGLLHLPLEEEDIA